MLYQNLQHGYTVNQPIADEFNKMYGVKYEVIRNVASAEHDTIPADQRRKIYSVPGGRK